MSDEYEYDFGKVEVVREEEQEVYKEEVLTGWTMLPCFKCEVRGEEMRLVCNSFLEWIFEHIFSHFWTGKICITGSKWEEVLPPPTENL